MPFSADKALRYMAVLRLKAERKTVAEIAAETGYAARSVKRILAAAAGMYDDRFRHRAA